MRGRLSHLLFATAFILSVMCGLGCGSAKVSFVSLDPKEIDPPPATATQFDASECYWWIDNNNELCVSIRSVKHNLLLGKYGRTEMLSSWVLGEPPAGSGRNYKIGPRETMTVFHTALQSTLLGSFAGIVGVLVDDENTIHGSFRIWAKQRTTHVTVSLLPPNRSPFLCFGEFKAVRNAERGKAIRAAAEKLGGRRMPPGTIPNTTSRPAAKPPIPTSDPTT